MSVAEQDVATDTLEFAVVMAVQAHAGVLDKAGEPYILHSMRVMLAVPPEARRVAILHDVPEDAGVNITQLEWDLGLSGAEGEALSLLTREAGQHYADYVSELCAASGMAGRLARAVKIADMRDNLRDPVGSDSRYGALQERYIRGLGELNLAARRHGD